MESSSARKLAVLNFLRARFTKFVEIDEDKIMQKIVLLLQKHYSEASKSKVTIMSELWFLADLPILLLAMGCYVVAGIWITIEWKFRRLPANLIQHPSVSSSITVTSRGRTITRPSTPVISSSQKSKGQYTRELVSLTCVLSVCLHATIFWKGHHGQLYFKI